MAAPKPKEPLAQRILSLEDVKALIGAAKTQRERTSLALMYGCGLRVSELCGLTWDDLQPRDDGGQATVYGKGSKTRVVLIPAVLWRRLVSVSCGASTDAVFVGSTGRALERTMVHRLIKDCASRAGVSEKASSHWLRHSHATHAILRGRRPVPASAVSQADGSDQSRPESDLALGDDQSPTSLKRAQLPTQ